MSHRLNERFDEMNVKYGAEASINRHVGKRITEDDARLIRAFISEKRSIDHIGPARSKSIAVHLVGMRRFITVEYRDMTIDDVILGIAALMDGRSQRFKRDGTVFDGGRLKPTTQQDYIKNLKTFIGWLNETQRPADRQINEKRLKRAQRVDGAGESPYRPEDLLSRAEKDSMIMAANILRDKVFISVLFETAARVGELGRMVWEDLKFTDDYVECEVWDTKAKKPRYPTLVDSRHLLNAYKNNYPGNPEGENFVFVEDDARPLTYIACIRILERAADRVIREAEDSIEAAVGLGMKRADAIAKYPNIRLKDKPYWKAHMYRHSSGTLMIDEGMTIPDVMEIMWANMNSEQIKRYVNRSRTQIRDSVLRHKGVKSAESVKVDSQPIRCPKCHDLNPAGKKFCGKCGRALTGEAALEEESAETVFSKLIFDDEYLEKFLKKRAILKEKS